jgi:hypothetical protein
MNPRTAKTMLLEQFVSRYLRTRDFVYIYVMRLAKFRKGYMLRATPVPRLC